MSELDTFFDVLDVHGVVGDVVDETNTAATLKVNAESALDTGPDFDTGHVDSVAHGDIIDIDILNEIVDLVVLSKGTNRDTVGTIAVKGLNENIGGIWLERDTIIVGIDDRILDDNIIGTV